STASGSMWTEVRSASATQWAPAATALFCISSTPCADWASSAALPRSASAEGRAVPCFWSRCDDGFGKGLARTRAPQHGTWTQRRARAHPYALALYEGRRRHRLADLRSGGTKHQHA